MKYSFDPTAYRGAKHTKETFKEVLEKLDHTPTVEEVIRNLPVRNPLIWLSW